MITNDQTQQLLTGGGNVVDHEGNKIGSIGQVYLDDKSGEPEWVTVKTGMFGGGESFVPLREANIDGNDLRVPYDKDKVKDAPRIEDAESHLSEEEESELYRYYGVGGSDYDASYSTSYDRGDSDHDASGVETDSAMTRSEEQLQVGTETREAGRARLRKYVVTENVTTTVPVSREEVRLERDPITDANRDEAMAGGDLTSEEHEVVLNEEKVVVNKETVPVERVRVEKDTVTEEHQVNEGVRKERIELDENASSHGQDTDERRV